MDWGLKASLVNSFLSVTLAIVRVCSEICTAIFNSLCKCIISIHINWNSTMVIPFMAVIFCFGDDNFTVGKASFTLFVSFMNMTIVFLSTYA